MLVWGFGVYMYMYRDITGQRVQGLGIRPHNGDCRGLQDAGVFKIRGLFLGSPYKKDYSSHAAASAV